MTQTVSDDVLGRFARQQNDWFTRVRAGSLDPEEIGRAVQQIIDRGSQAASVDDTPTIAQPVPATSYPFVVPYRGKTTIKELVAAGKYDWHNDDITDANFPQKQEGDVEVTVELVHFDRDISTKDAEQELDKRGLRGANAAEILAFGAKHPEVQREYPLIALGQQWRRRLGRHLVVCLGWGGSKRVANLRWIDLGWPRDCRFAAVRK